MTLLLFLLTHSCCSLIYCEFTIPPLLSLSPISIMMNTFQKFCFWRQINGPWTHMHHHLTIIPSFIIEIMNLGSYHCANMIQSIGNYNCLTLISCRWTELVSLLLSFIFPINRLGINTFPLWWETIFQFCFCKNIEDNKIPYQKLLITFNLIMIYQPAYMWNRSLTVSKDTGPSTSQVRTYQLPVVQVCKISLFLYLLPPRHIYYDDN